MFSEFNIAVNTDSLTLCDRCYNEYYFTCDGCGEVHHIDDAEYVNDAYYCRYCADDYHGRIHSYTYKPVPVFYGGNAGYGIELEIDDGDCRQDAAKDIQAAGGDHIYIKEDGSLSYAGMEIVTHPASLEYHVKHFPWADICDAALYHGYRSHDTDTCGLHIHASRALFGDGLITRDLNIAKCMLLIDAYWENYVVPFSRRDYEKLDQWAKKPDAGISSSDDGYTAIDKAKKTANKGRYQAVNLQNHQTVEFRFFRGTLRRNTIIASIQFLDTLINYAKKTELRDIFKKSFLDIFGNTGYPELTEYLKLRKLIKE